jgi:hypothetical protein
MCEGEKPSNIDRILNFDFPDQSINNAMRVASTQFKLLELLIGSRLLFVFFNTLHALFKFNDAFTQGAHYTRQPVAEQQQNHEGNHKPMHYAKATHWIPRGAKELRAGGKTSGFHPAKRVRSGRTGETPMPQLFHSTGTNWHVKPLGYPIRRIKPFRRLDL